MKHLVHALVFTTLMGTMPFASAKTPPRLDHLCAAILVSANSVGERIESTTIAARAALMTPINKLRTRLDARKSAKKGFRTHAYSSRKPVFDVDVAHAEDAKIAEAMHARLISLEARLARSTTESAPAQAIIKGDAEIRAYLQGVLKTTQDFAATARAKLEAAKLVFLQPQAPTKLTRPQEWSVFFGYVATTAGMTMVGHALAGTYGAGVTAVGYSGAWWIVRDEVFDAAEKSKNWMMTTWAEFKDAFHTSRLTKLEEHVARAEQQILNTEAMLRILDEDVANQSIAYESFPVKVALDPALKAQGVSAESITSAITKGLAPVGLRARKLEVHNLLFHNGHSFELHVYVMKRGLREFFSGVTTTARARIAKLVAKTRAGFGSDASAPTKESSPSEAPDSTGSASSN